MRSVLIISHACVLGVVLGISDLNPLLFFDAFREWLNALPLKMVLGVWFVSFVWYIISIELVKSIERGGVVASK